MESFTISSAIENMLSSTAQTCLDLLISLLPIIAPIVGAYFMIIIVIQILHGVFADPDYAIRDAFMDHSEYDYIDPETGEIIDWDELEEEEGSWSWDDEE